MTNTFGLVSKLFLLYLVFLSQMAVSQYVQSEEQSEQEDFDKEGYIGIGIGFSNPNGNYADEDLNFFYYGSGFAKTGYNINIKYGKLFTPNLGLALMLSHSSHGFNTDEIVAHHHLNDPFASHSIVVGRYNTTGYLGGLLLSFPLKNGYFDITAMIGYSSSTAPSYSYTRSDSVSVDYFDISSSTSGSITSNFGVGFRLNLNHALALNFSLDFYSTRPDFQHTITSNLSDPQHFMYSLQMSMTNTTIGLVYRIPSF